MWKPRLVLQHERKNHSWLLPLHFLLTQHVSLWPVVCRCTKKVLGQFDLFRISQIVISNWTISWLGLAPNCVWKSSYDERFVWIGICTGSRHSTPIPVLNFSHYLQVHVQSQEVRSSSPELNTMDRTTTVPRWPTLVTMVAARPSRVRLMGTGEKSGSHPALVSFLVK